MAAHPSEIQVEMAERGRPFGFLYLGAAWNNFRALVTEGETQLLECARR